MKMCADLAPVSLVPPSAGGREASPWRLRELTVPDPFGVVVVVPGRGVAAERYDWLGRAANQARWAAVVVDGLYGDLDDRGGPRAYQAVREVVSTRGGPVAVAGHSTGARVALRAAADCPVAGAVALCPIADLSDHVRRAAAFLPDYAAAVVADLGPPGSAAYDERSPLLWAAELTAPLLLVAAQEDRVCPPYQTTMLADAIRAAGGSPRVEVIRAAGHFFERGAATASAEHEVGALLVSWLGGLTG
jgi:alpha-beta hydrolase superfamily lysophospholipase